MEPKPGNPAVLDEDELRPHAPQGERMRRLLGSFHVTGVFWFRLRGNRWHKAADASLAELAREHAVVTPSADLRPSAPRHEPIL